MMKLFGTKKLMTQMFAENGQVLPVTVIDISDVVLAYKSDSRALIGIGKLKSPSKPAMGMYKELGYVPVQVVEVDLSQVVDMNVGDKLSTSLLDGIESVDVTGFSKGKGFAGVVRKYGFKGGPKTHGQSDRNRAPGSIGSGTTPGRVLKGKKMPGRWGNVKIKVKNLKVIKVDAENMMVVVKGAIPGNKDSNIIISFEK
jgi:large subunit ribosomal protein L3